MAVRRSRISLQKKDPYPDTQVLYRYPIAGLSQIIHYSETNFFCESLDLVHQTEKQGNACANLPMTRI
jgi:hypothetical protein